MSTNMPPGSVSRPVSSNTAKVHYNKRKPGLKLRHKELDRTSFLRTSLMYNFSYEIRFLKVWSVMLTHQRPLFDRSPAPQGSQ
jgi:hypothetical protein